MNKKLIVIGLSVLMTLTVFSGFSFGAVQSNYTTYNIPIIVNNYTIPDANYNISGMGTSTPYNVITKHSPTHTLTEY